MAARFARAARAGRAVRADRSLSDDARAGSRTAARSGRHGARRGAAMSLIDDYRRVAPPGAVDFILKLAEQVKGRRFLHVTGGRLGGGATETLRAAVPILSELAVDTRWEVTGGDNTYYTTARSLQAALEGAERVLSEEGLARWVDMNGLNAKKLDLDADLTLVHDSQPASLVSSRTSGGRWVWRCHFDCSSAQAGPWTFFRRFADLYDAAVFALPGFEGRLGIPMYIVPPSIDPLSERNRDLTPREITEILMALGVARDKPLLVQIARFSRVHDPLGVVNAYQLVKKHHDVRLVLAGTADGEPERLQLLSHLLEVAQEDRDVVVLELPPEVDRQLDGLAPAELAVSVLTYNNAATVPAVVDAVHAGLEKHFTGTPAVLINADAGSSDTTVDRLAESGLPFVRAHHAAPA